MKKIILFLFSFLIIPLISSAQINEDPVNGYSPVSWDKISFFESKLIDNSKNEKSLAFSIKTDKGGFLEIQKNLNSEIFVESYKYSEIWISPKSINSDVEISIYIGLNDFHKIGSFSLKKSQENHFGIIQLNLIENISIFDKVKIIFEFQKSTELEIIFDDFHCKLKSGSKIVIDNFGDDEKVEEEEKENFLSQNYPNPFNPITTIKYEIIYESFVKLTVYDVIGREVKTLVNEYLSSGEYEVVFNGTDLMSGIYYYKLEAENFVEVKKMILLK